MSRKAPLTRPDKVSAVTRGHAHSGERQSLGVGRTGDGTGSSLPPLLSLGLC